MKKVTKAYSMHRQTDRQTDRQILLLDASKVRSM